MPYELFMDSDDVNVANEDSVNELTNVQFVSMEMGYITHESITMETQDVEEVPSLEIVPNIIVDFEDYRGVNETFTKYVTNND